MKRIYDILILLFFFNIVSFGQAIKNGAFLHYSLDSTLNANIYLSHNQYALTHTAAQNNDVVGIWDYFWPTRDTITSGSFSFNMIDSEDGLYTMSDSLVIIADKTKLVAGIDTITIRTTLQGIFQDYYMYITVKDSANCVYIDPDAVSDGSGSRTSPRNVWPTSYTAGKAYLQKRGTSYSTTITINNSGTSDNNIYFGAYSSGTRPEISTTTTTNGFTINASYIKIFEYYITGNNYGIYKGHGSAPSYTVYHDITISDCLLSANNSGNGQLDLSLDFATYTWPTPSTTWYNVYIYDVVSNSSVAGSGIKVEGGKGVYIENVHTASNLKYGISCAFHSTYATMFGVLSKNNGTTAAVELSGKYHELSYSVVTGATNGSVILVDDPGSSNTTISHCVINGGQYKGAIVLDANSTDAGMTWADEGWSFTIEDNDIYGANSSFTAGIITYYGIRDVTIQRNRIHGCHHGIKLGRLNTSGSNITVSYNLFYENTYTDIIADSLTASNVSGVYVYNNVIDGNINITTSSTNVVRNNYFRYLVGSTTATNNIDIDTITTSVHFTSFSGHDYTLLSTATSAIDQAYDWGQTTDFVLRAKQGSLWDIGAYEYTYPIPVIMPPSRRRIIVISL